MTIKPVNLSVEEKELLEELSGRKIYTKGSFGDNKNVISELKNQAKVNASVYLKRNRLNQKLSLFEESNLFNSIVSLKESLGLKKTPRRIECYDISHISGKFVYGSMVTFVDGRPSKKFYRLFRVKDQNNDFANLQEVLTRRVKKSFEKAEDLGWKLPDLVIIDGGKGQLSSILRVFDDFINLDVEICSLAKKEEEIFVPNKTDSIIVQGQVKFLVQRIRDEAHRFAINNNRKARLKVAKKSQLDEISGIGEKTKQVLLSVFGSVENLVDNLWKNPDLIKESVGQSKLNILKKHFGIDK